MNFHKLNHYAMFILCKIEELKNEKDYIIFCKEELFTKIDTNSFFVEIIKFKDINNILNHNIIEEKIKRQYIQMKIYLFINYVDKLLKNKIIEIKDENNRKHNYLDDLVIKISQELAIFYNYDISKYNDNVIELEKLKDFIKSIYSTIDVSKFKNDIIESITKKLNKKLFFIRETEFVMYNKIFDIYKTKFSNGQSVLDNIFYKYFEKKYNNNIKKFLKDTIINDFLNNIPIK